MAEESGVVVKPVNVKQDGQTTEIEIHIEKPEEQKQQEPKKERRRTLTERLYAQIDIMEREQGKIASGYEGSQNPKRQEMNTLLLQNRLPTRQTPLSTLNGEENNNEFQDSCRGF